MKPFNTSHRWAFALALILAAMLLAAMNGTMTQAAIAPAPPPRPLADPGDILGVFTNTWSYSTMGLVYDLDLERVRYAHESQSSSHNPTVYDVTQDPPAHTVEYSFALSLQNSGWPWQLDNRTGAGYDYVAGTYFIPDYNGDLSYADDNIVEVDAAGVILNAWEMDDEVDSNDSADGSEIDSVIDIAVVPGTPTRYFVTAAYDDNVVYEVALNKTGTWWTPNSWHTVATCTVPIWDSEDDNLGIDYDAQNHVLYHSNWDTTTVVLTDLACDGGNALGYVDHFECPGAGGYNSGVTLIEGAATPAVWVTDFSSDQTTRCRAPGEAPVTTEWRSIVDGTPWTAGLSITTETSDTFQVTDVITAVELFTLTDRWHPDRLLLAGFDVDPPLVHVLTATDALTFTSGAATPNVVTLTQRFLTRPCTWTHSLVSRTLEVETTLFERRPFTVTKTAPRLQITSDAVQSQVYAGSAVSFTLHYANAGGFENAVVITNTFPLTAPIIYAKPQPATAAADGTWARWDVGDLATGAGGSIGVYVYISETLTAGTQVAIWDGIHDHVGQVRDEVTTTFEVLGAAPQGWIKTIEGRPWTPMFSLTLQTYDTFTVTDVFTVAPAFNLAEGWITAELKLARWAVEPDSYETYVSADPGLLTLNAPLSSTSAPRPITLTKTFTVATCSWPQTFLGEAFWIGTSLPTFRPVRVLKRAPVLDLSAANPTPEVNGGELVTYTLTYSNTGGYENAVSVRSDLPPEIVLVTSKPPTTTGTTWVFTDGLATGQRGYITVTARITDEVPPVTRLVITNTLLDHGGLPRDVALVIYERGAPLWEKAINGETWSFTQRTAVDAGDTFTVTDVISAEAAFHLIDHWRAEHLTLIEALPEGGSVLGTAGRLTWTVTVPVPGGVTLTKRFRTQPFTTSHTVLWEELHTGGVAWERRPVVLERLPPDLRLTKAVTPTLAGPGARITYTLVFSNAGPGTAVGVTLTDTLPISVTDTAVVSSGVSITPQNGTRYVWDVADLAPYDGGTLTVTGVLSDPLPASLVANVAEIDARNALREHPGTTPGDAPAPREAPSAAAYSAVDGDPLTCTLNAPISGTTYAFCNGICGDVTFVDTGTVRSLAITFTQRYPSINGEGLPRQYRLAADGSGYEARVTLCYRAGELAIAGISPEAEGDLRGFRYQGNGLWAAPAGQTVDGDANTLLLEGITAFSAWGIGIPGSDEPTTLALWRLEVQADVALWIGVAAVSLTAAVVGWHRRSKRR
jgi:uncharacterized repeat protein (TIGR01451 family)